MYFPLVWRLKALHQWELKSSEAFSDIYPILAMRVSFFSPWSTWKLFKSLFLYLSSLPSSAFPDFSIYPLLVPCISLAQAPSSTCVFKCFGKAAWEATPALGMLQIAWNKGKSLCWSLRKLPDLCGDPKAQFFEIKVRVGPSSTNSGHEECGQDQPRSAIRGVGGLGREAL